MAKEIEVTRANVSYSRDSWSSAMSQFRSENHSGLMVVLPRRPRKRSCDSMTDSSSCARSSPARPRLGLFVRSLSRRSAA